MKKAYQLRTERKQFAKLIHVGICMLFLFIFSSNKVNAQLVGWKFRDGITVHENAGAQKLNYQVLLNINTASLISAGKMNNKGNDIRFSKDCAGATLLNYFLDTNTINSSNTQIWVELDTLKSNGNYLMYMWYGNSTATAASNFNNTFPLSTQLIVPTGTITLSGTNNYSWIEVQAGAGIIVTPNSPLVLNARKIKIAGTINGNGAGYLGGQSSTNGGGPGGGKAGAAVTPANTSGGGGAYGGDGGNGNIAAITNGNGGIAYGSTTAIDMGSGGGGPVGVGAGATDGNGGAAVTMQAYIVEITGQVNLNGNNGTSASNVGWSGGAGAGGGFLMQTYKAIITGTISANGGNGGSGNAGGGGGGGGRINLYSETPFAAGTYSVMNGLKGPTTNTNNPAASDGQPGVVFTGTMATNEPTYSFVPHVTLSSSAFPICQGSTATFTASAGFSPYKFYVDTAMKQNSTSTTYSITMLNNGNKVKVLAGDANGCLDTSNVITAVVNPKPTVTLSQATAICQGQSTVLTASGGSTYNWSPASSLSSPNGSSVTASPTVTTTYTVLVTDNNSCQNSDTVTVTVNGCTHIRGHSSFFVDLYPNPSQASITITTDLENTSELKVMLCDILGNTIRLIDQAKLSGTYKKEIDVTDLAGGIYFISVKAGNGLVTKKFVKN